MINLSYEKYNDKQFAVRGDIDVHSEFIKTLKGRKNKRMKGGPGWLVSIEHEDKLKTFVENETNQPVYNTKYKSESFYENKLETYKPIVSDTKVLNKVEDEVEEVEEVEDEVEEVEVEDEVEEEVEEEVEDEVEEEVEEEVEDEVEEEVEEEVENKEEVEDEVEEVEVYEVDEVIQHKGEEEPTEEDEIETENIKEDEKRNNQVEPDSSQLVEIIEYYKKFSNPKYSRRQGSDKNYLTIIKVIKKLNFRVNRLEHKYNKLKNKYNKLQHVST